jgi:auxin influx carrier (AUX1 LAX family)
MLGQIQAEESMVYASNETETNGSLEEEKHGGVDGKEGEDGSGFGVKSFLWHGGSAWDAWFSCASNQVAQVLLTLPYSFSQLGMASGIVFQIFYGIMGSWTAYLISVLYVEYRTRKEKENVSFKNHVIQVFVTLHHSHFLPGSTVRGVGSIFCSPRLVPSQVQLKISHLRNFIFAG